MALISTFEDAQVYCTECGRDVPLARAIYHLTHTPRHSQDQRVLVMEINGQSVPIDRLYMMCSCGKQGPWRNMRSHLMQYGFTGYSGHLRKWQQAPVAFYPDDAEPPPGLLEELKARRAQVAQSSRAVGTATKPQAGKAVSEPAIPTAADDAPTPGELLGAGGISMPPVSTADDGVPLGGNLDTEVLAADPSRINVQIEVPTWLITVWDIGYRARGYDGTFARWIVELLTLHFVRCKGLSLSLIVHPRQPATNQEG
jgi:hypothetical protein